MTVEDVLEIDAIKVNKSIKCINKSFCYYSAGLIWATELSLLSSQSSAAVYFNVELSIVISAISISFYKTSTSVGLYGWLITY